MQSLVFGIMIMDGWELSTIRFFFETNVKVEIHSPCPQWCKGECHLMIHMFKVEQAITNFFFIKVKWLKNFKMIVRIINKYLVKSQLI
jgi:hypothetical protein